MQVNLSSICLSSNDVKLLTVIVCFFFFSQVDEPVLMRYPDQALEYGIEQLSSCFNGVSASDVVKTVHLCCGYPNYLVSGIPGPLFYMK